MAEDPPQIVGNDPANADSLYRFAQTRCRQGGFAEGAELLRRVLAIEPQNAHAHVLLGRALVELGDAREALASFERAIGIAPDLADAHGNRGDVLAALGRQQEAVASYERAIAIEPGGVENWLNRGAALLDLGQYDEALKSYDRVAELAPDFAQAHFNRAHVLLQLERDSDALIAFDQGLARDPANPHALNSLGNILASLGRSAEALHSFERALALDPDHFEALINHGAIAFKLERFEEAHASFRRALQLRPDDADARYRLGFALGALHRHEEALATYAALLRIKPDHQDALLNHGIELQHLGRDEEALASFAQVIARNPDHVDAHLNRAFACLTLGDYRRGLPEFEWRLKKYKAWERHAGSAWRGREPLAGKTLLLYCEQGLGDSIQMVRYVPLLARQGARIVLEVPAPLKALMSRVEGTAIVVAAGEPIPAFDYHCPLMSLPFALGTEPDTIPAQVPYLTAPPDRVATWTARLPPAPQGRLRVGINWCGNPAFRDDRNRSMALERFTAVLATAGVDFIGLNPGITPVDAQRLSAMPDVFHPAAAFRDFADTAAVMASLDLVITTDTAIAHLAGALGRPLWIMLASAPDWRWALDGAGNRWYPTARAFRQASPGDWRSVIDTVRRELETLATGR